MKRIVFLLIFFIIIVICGNSFAKYIIEDDVIVAEIKIDSQIPIIELGNVTNDNLEYPKYANKTNEINIQIKVIEKNIKENNFEKNNVQILVGNEIVEPKTYEIHKISENDDTMIYNIKLKEILGDGKLKIKVKEGTIKDKADQINVETILDTNIKIDNTPPVISFFQEEIEDRKVVANLDSNEEMRKVNGWTLLENNKQLIKEFQNNVTYPFTVTDLAGNKAKIDINITKATNIQIRYGALNSNSKWSFGYGNNEIAGKEVILSNPLYKTEGISLYYDGNIEKDFIQLQSYIYTYWGPGKQGLCNTYETRYNYGYNPGEGKFDTMNTKLLSNIERKFSIYQGGYGMNIAKNKGLSGTPIPEDIANQYLFGISGLKIQLKDYSYYSIVYQIFVKDYGWIKPACDGEETYYDRDKPISGFRMSLIPKTEKQYLLDYWSEDIGTNNMK